MCIRKRIIAILIVLSILLTPVFSAGAPVFDVENWIYSILEYSQMGQDTLNFVNEAKRQYELAEKIYKAINDGDLLAAVSSVSRMSTRLDKSLQKYGIQSEIYSQINEIARSSAEWGNHLDDPDYFLDMINNIQTLDDQISNATMQSLEDKKTDAREDSEELSQTTTSVGTGSESQTEIGNKQYNELAKSNAQTPVNKMDQATSELAAENKQTLTEIKQEAQYQYLKAKNNAAEKAIEQAIIDNAPDIGIDVSDPFAL